MFQQFCKFALKLTGWKISGLLPRDHQYVAIVGPHTSNWDFIIGVLARGALGSKVNFLGKHQLFIPPWGWFFKAIGGTPVDRRKSNNLVDAVVLLFKENPKFSLALAPEGTRSPVKRWKTGFYHIASKANVPIVTIGLDFDNKKVLIPDGFDTTEDMQQDMDRITSFYRSINGRHPKAIPDFTPHE
ncbi:lysophospholipid acyltransferase family protein [Shewanella sp. D64]|uniref:lysophospholipid acyltransferase family protein n=1 Tax=unclassified Shewanella TaxID=196818 RepID=UPI0022BA4B7D|nr:MULTISPECIES: lysophospholipid acyltransferase family protein [unclassified Shewanella]MEC4726286.1 lysophospholipid acyltransferase family protein [Shewanella sp. D64]MEC4738298.1 lysophospholipid acyltransferase family protein [Shewanella sp. E94]WBJ95434.1 lysophospholipid acyltransferase family protein [Shewanella sp. MTB7]